MSTGHVYVLSNSAMPGLIKIGFTTRSIRERIEELSHTGVPAKFEIELEISTVVPEMLEKRLHILFAPYHFQKEFFKCDLEIATKIIKKHLKSYLLTRGHNSNALFFTFYPQNRSLLSAISTYQIRSAAQLHTPLLRVAR